MGCAMDIMLGAFASGWTLGPVLPAPILATNNRAQPHFTDSWLRVFGSPAS